MIYDTSRSNHSPRLAEDRSDGADGRSGAQRGHLRIGIDSSAVTLAVGEIMPTVSRVLIVTHGATEKFIEDLLLGIATAGFSLVPQVVSRGKSVCCTVLVGMGV